MEIASHPTGTFCFPELSTRDVEAAKRFYSSLLGWTPFDVPSAAGSYALARINGHDVADCAQAVGRTRTLGGRVITGPNTVPESGTFAVLADTEDAVFCVLQSS